MSKLKKHVKADKAKWIIVFSLITILLLAVIGTAIKLNSTIKTKQIGQNSFSYAIGLLDEEGAYEQGTISIYTKDFYTVDGLKCELKEDATITYKVVFYDEDKVFISEMDNLSEDFDASNTSEDLSAAKYFKIEITPTNDPEVSFFEIDGYARQLTVTYNK